MRHLSWENGPDSNATPYSGLSAVVRIAGRWAIRTPVCAVAGWDGRAGCPAAQAKDGLAGVSHWHGLFSGGFSPL